MTSSSLQFCSERRILEYEEEEELDGDEEEVVDTSGALISLMQNMKHHETDNDVTNHQEVVSDGCFGYQWLVKTINKFVAFLKLVHLTSINLLVENLKVEI